MSVVINVEVPVRVFKDGKFIDNLTLKDFEIWEDGVPQRAEAVYLIKKDIIERKEEEKKKFMPQTERTFFLLFELHEYDPRISQTVDEFIHKILLPNDSLIAVTPVNTYRLKDKGLEIKSREEIAEELKSLLRKDVVMGSGEYRSALKDLEEIAQILTVRFEDDMAEKLRIMGQLGGQKGVEMLELDSIIFLYQSYLQKLETLREVNQLRLLDFAQYLKSREGQNYVFLFYQREFIPQIDPKALINSSSFQELGGDISILLKDADILNRDVTVDIDKVKKAYADASTAVHFMYITRQPENIPGVFFAERSSDIFAPFLELSMASGGFAESSANPDYLFKKAVEASENYYLLYYAPKNYRNDGKFRNIKVGVKGKGYKVIHRLGYFSN